MTAPGKAGAPAVHRDPARGYLSTAVLAALIVAAFLADVAIGGGPAHAVAWIVVFVLVVGIDALIVHAVRTHRSVVVTQDEVRVGEASLAREHIVGYSDNPAPGTPVLGHRWGSLPRGIAGLAVQLSDGSTVLVPARHPARLATVLRARRHEPGVRPAEPEDLPLLAEIDERADALFRVAGIDLPAVPYPVDGLHRARAVFVHGRPPDGFVQVDEVDGLAHVQELAVLPGQMRLGHGSALLEAACAWARDHGYEAITLTTYADVPWNAPFYAARGFAATAALGPEMAELRDRERAVGLDGVGTRVVMRRALQR
ncbi:MAG: GNAT family N-acetyltransferase [Jatrophihabitans sp.]|nr:MAG: GNAT family N-acetyltransferase [Jatrophihabitans sp.]